MKKGLAALAAAALVTVGSAGVVIAGDRGAPDNSNDVYRAIDSRKAAITQLCARGA